MSRDKSNKELRGLRFWLFWAAWAGVVIAVLITNPAYFLRAYAFPIGLAVFFGPDETFAMKLAMIGPSAWFAGWMIYIGLAFIMSSVKRRWQFYLVYTIFCILLAFNVAGCKKVMDIATQLE
jgi:hypothetical protein